MANSVDPDQTAPVRVCSGSTLFASILKSSVMLDKYLQQTTSADDIFRGIFSWRFKGFNSLHTCFFMPSADFSKSTLSGIASKRQTVWIQTKPDVLSGLT